jgi:hypothetical protein
MGRLSMKQLILMCMLTFPSFLVKASQKSTTAELTEKKSITKSASLSYVNSDQDQISDGISGHKVHKKGMHIRVGSNSSVGSDSGSVKIGSTPLATPQSSRASVSSKISYSKNRSSRTESRLAKDWMHCSSEEESTKKFLKELSDKGDVESIAKILKRNLSKSVLCAILPIITQSATTVTQNDTVYARELSEVDKRAVAIAYFNTGFAASRNDPKGGKKLGKSYKPAARIADRIGQAKLIKPGDLKVFKDMIAAEKAQAKIKKLVVEEYVEKEHKHKEE